MKKEKAVPLSMQESFCPEYYLSNNGKQIPFACARPEPHL